MILGGFGSHSGSQNGNKMDGKIMHFPSFWRKGENAQNYLFYNIKRASGQPKMYEKSSLFIVLPGGIGTLDECVEVLTLIQLKQIK